MDHIIEQYWEFDAKQISAESHKYQGWRLVEDREDVPLGPGLLGDRPITEQDIRIEEAIEREL